MNREVKICYFFCNQDCTKNNPKSVLSIKFCMRGSILECFKTFKNFEEIRLGNKEKA